MRMVFQCDLNHRVLQKQGGIARTEQSGSRQAVVNMVMNLWYRWSAGNSWTGWV